MLKTAARVQDERTARLAQSIPSLTTLRSLVRTEIDVEDEIVCAIAALVQAMYEDWEINKQGPDPNRFSHERLVDKARRYLESL